jgi:hypothetical protein
MRCATCNAVITLPTGVPDALAHPGDLCDECMEAERVAASVRQEFVLEEALDRRLRERP